MVVSETLFEFTYTPAFTVTYVFNILTVLELLIQKSTIIHFRSFV